FPIRGASPPPLAILDAKLPVTGENDAAGNPFWFNNQPSVVVNPVALVKSAKKTWNGRRVLNSGLPLGAKPKPYDLRFRRTGTFTYYCVVHPGMKATVRVVSPTRRIASPAQVKARQTREIRAYVSAATRKTAAKPPAGAT